MPLSPNGASCVSCATASGSPTQWQPAHAVGLVIADALEFLGASGFAGSCSSSSECCHCRPICIVDDSVPVIVLRLPCHEPAGDDRHRIDIDLPACLLPQRPHAPEMARHFPQTRCHAIPSKKARRSLHQRKEGQAVIHRPITRRLATEARRSVGVRGPARKAWEVTRVSRAFTIGVPQSEQDDPKARSFADRTG